MADHIIAVQRGKKVGWLSGHGPPSNTPPFTGSDIDADLFEPVVPGPAADTTLYTADNTIWPTADGGILEGAADVLDAVVIVATNVVETANAADLADAFVIAAADVVEAADALDALDAIIIAVGAAVLVEATDATDVLDAEVIAASVPEGIGGYYRPPRPFPVEGAGYGVLPGLEGEAHGIVIVAGAGAGALPGLIGAAAGTIGVAGRSAAQLVVRAAAIGDRGQAGAGAAVLKGLSVASEGAAGAHGSGSGMIVQLEGATSGGRHDDDEAAVMTFLLAA